MLSNLLCPGWPRRGVRHYPRSIRHGAAGTQPARSLRPLHTGTGVGHTPECEDEASAVWLLAPAGQAPGRRRFLRGAQPALRCSRTGLHSAPFLAGWEAGLEEPMQMVGALRLRAALQGAARTCCWGGHRPPRTDRTPPRPGPGAEEAREPEAPDARPRGRRWNVLQVRKTRDWGPVRAGSRGGLRLWGGAVAGGRGPWLVPSVKAG